MGRKRRRKRREIDRDDIENGLARQEVLKTPHLIFYSRHIGR